MESARHQSRQAKCDGNERGEQRPEVFALMVFHPVKASFHTNESVLRIFRDLLQNSDAGFHSPIMGRFAGTCKSRSPRRRRRHALLKTMKGL